MIEHDSVTYYAEPGRMTDPGPYAALLDVLPRDIPALVKALQGVMVHIFWAESYGLHLSDERPDYAPLRAASSTIWHRSRAAISRAMQVAGFAGLGSMTRSESEGERNGL